MLNKEDIIRFLIKHKQFLKSNYHLNKIGIFGSFVRDEQKENSDIDFLVEFEKDTECLFEIKFELKKFLQSSFDRNVDICREKYLKPYIRNYILKEILYA
jgi:predicted nucleotidyltransferase